MKRIPYIVLIIVALLVVHSLLFFTQSCRLETGVTDGMHITPVDIRPEIQVTDGDIILDKSGLFPILKQNPAKWNEGNRKEVGVDQPEEIFYGESDIRFANCHFTKEFLPYFYSYQTPVIFSLCSFGSSGTYSDTHAPFGFLKLHFQNTITFEQNNFYKDIYFNDCQFDGRLQFAMENNFLDGTCTFMNCLAKSGIKFEKADPADTAKSLQGPTEIEFSEDTVRRCLDFSGYNFKNTALKLTDTWLDSLNLQDITLTEILSLRAGSLQRHYEKKNWAHSAFLRFLLSPYFDEWKERKTALNITGTDIEKISLDYSYFKLYFPKTASANDISALYKQLLDKYSHDGELMNYQAVDIDFHEYQGGIFNKVSHYWWNYGYNKQRIFVWTFLFMLAFATINYFNLSKAIDSYKIDNIQKWINDSGRRSKYHKAKKLLASILYTSGIFFGIKLNFEKLQFSRVGYAVFILIQFLVGLVCTGFIVNLIFSK
jgi:hypothetical protein